MKRALAAFVGVGLSCGLTAIIISTRLTARHAAELSAQQAVWQQEKANLEAALAGTRTVERAGVAPLHAAPTVAPLTNVVSKSSPADLLARLRALKPAPGSRMARQAIHDFEELIAAGPAALPVIREFLARNEDADFGAGQGKGRSSVPDDFILPPTLRLGLLEAVKQIGGSDAEKILADTIGSTGSGAELAWLTRALQQAAPNQYRDAALAAAHSLLARPLNPANPLERNDRENLFSVLALYGDASYVSTAQAQLLQADGTVDRSALRYLQQSLGPQAVAIAAQTWNDPRLNDPAKKEPLARVALNFVGADAQANEFYYKAISDMSLPKDARRNLIEDLNQDGFADRKNLGSRDLPLIENRIALIEQLAPSATDPINAAAFKEAYKDLLNMRERVLHPPPPKQ